MYNSLATTENKIFIQFPLSIYLGWISIATIACISSYLNAIHWSGWHINESNWAVIMICIATVITLYMIVGKSNIFYGLVFIWALYGLIVKRMEAEGNLNTNIINFGIGGIAIAAMACLVKFIRSFAQKPDTALTLQNHPLK